MARSIHDVIRKMKPFDPRVRHVAASFRFDLEGVGSFRLEVNHGKLLAREDPSPADCVIACTEEDFVRVVDGEQNMLTALMQGRLRMEGDLALVKLLHGLMPAAQNHSEQEGAQP